MKRELQEAITWRAWFERLNAWKDSGTRGSIDIQAKPWIKEKTKTLGMAAVDQFRALYADERAQRDELAGRRFRGLYGYGALDRKIKHLDQLAKNVAGIVGKQIETYQRDLDSERESRAASERQSAREKRMVKARSANASINRLEEAVRSRAPCAAQWPALDPSSSGDFESVDAVISWLESEAPSMNARDLASKPVLELGNRILAREKEMAALGNVLTITCGSSSGTSLTAFVGNAVLVDGALGRIPYRFVAFWTAVHSCLRYAELADGDESVEADRTGVWVTGWWEAAKEWPQEYLESVGCPRGRFGTAVARVGSSAVETSLGSDVVLIFWANDGGSQRAHVMNIQFKRADEGNATLNVERNAWRQFAALAKAQTKSKGLIKGWYGLLRNRDAGIASLCAVDLDQAAKALGQNIEAINATSENFSFDWTKVGESLPTAVLRSLNTQAYKSPSDAMQALAANAGRELNGYVIVQAFGFEQRHLNSEMKRSSEIAKEFDLRFEHGEKVEREILREFGNDQEHTYERGGMSR